MLGSFNTGVNNAGSAAELNYNNEKSGISASNVQSALENAFKIPKSTLTVYIKSSSTNHPITLSGPVGDDHPGIFEEFPIHGKAFFKLYEPGLYRLSCFDSRGREHTCFVEAFSYTDHFFTAPDFLATIQVTALPGAVVYASSGEKTFPAAANASGVASVKVECQGGYTIRAASGQAVSNSAFVTVSQDGATYNTAVKFPRIILSSPQGCHISISDGNSTFTAPSSGNDTFLLPNTGMWRVSVSQTGSSDSMNVHVFSYDDYYAEMSLATPVPENIADA